MEFLLINLEPVFPRRVREILLSSYGTRTIPAGLVKSLNSTS